MEALVVLSMSKLGKRRRAIRAIHLECLCLCTVRFRALLIKTELYVTLVNSTLMKCFKCSLQGFCSKISTLQTASRVPLGGQPGMPAEVCASE